jgi:glutamine cyclotransferase
MRIKPHYILILCACTVIIGACGRAKSDATTSEAVTVVPRLVRTLPHDSTAFTQGLLFYGDSLLESTGAPRGRESSLRVIDPRTGAVRRHQLVPGVFAEGIAVAGEKLVQLTWRSGMARVYTLPGLAAVGWMRYNGEGWGLTHDGESFVMSNGSDTLYWRNTAFEITRRVAVTLKGKPLSNLNELEYAPGKVYANVWFSSYVFDIDPRSGEVRRMIDCTALVRKAGGNEHRVLNGIAYNPSTETFFVTGKDWGVMFEVGF